MEAGDSFELAGYNFVFEGTRGVRGPNFMADEGTFIVYKSASASPPCTRRSATTAAARS